MSYAIIQTGGKQYRVSEGDVLSVEKLDAETGKETTFSNVLLVVNGDKINLGAPLVTGASVQAEVVEQYKDEKVIAFKKRRRQNSRRKRGHRQVESHVKITAIG
jgi:large subunit ribosomal protein L21